MPVAKTDEKFKGHGALDAFLNLLTLITSGWLAWSLGAMSFQLTNKYFGTIVYGSTYFNESVLKTAIASALIVAPVYYFVMFALHRKYKAGELNQASGVHRWLTYLMLLISALSIIGSLIALISGFLNGDYTANVILKIITIIVIAGAIFGYYFYDLKRRDYARASLVSIVAGWSAAALLSVFVVASFFNITQPGLARLQLLDTQTVTAVNNVYTLVLTSYRGNGKLPQDLDMSQLVSSSDPAIYKKIGYRLINENQFEICAEFLAPTPAAKRELYLSYNDGIWANHTAGKVCHTYDIKQEESKVYGKAAAAIEAVSEADGAVKQ